MRILLIILVFFAGIAVQAQRKVIHNNEAAYLHVVEKGNTLYGISKQYAVPIASLLEMNPGADVGLNLGQKIYIRISDVNRKEAKRSPEMDGSFLIHSVARGETLYSLTKKYQTSQQAIYEANPELQATGLKKGAEIKIPINRVLVEQSLVLPAVSDSLQRHEVIQGETLYSISKQFSVDIADIKDVNGGLDEGLKTGMSLRLPIRKDGGELAGNLEENVEPQMVSPTVSTEGIHLDIGLLLPFSLGSGESGASVLPRGSDDIIKMTDIAFEFYRGSQLALDELKSKGLSANITVIDVTSSQKSIDRSIAHPGLAEVDFMIGPFHKNAFEAVSKQTKFKQVVRVSPLSNTLGQSAATDQSVSRIKSSDEELMAYLVDDIKRNHLGATVVLASGAKRSLHKEFKSAWLRTDTVPNPDQPKLKEMVWDKDGLTKLLAKLDPTGPNVLVYPVADKPAITDLISNLATTTFRDHDITLYGTEEWMNYDNLDAEILERVNLHLCTSSFIDFESTESKDFIKTYYKRFSTIPSAAGYAQQAYDITMYYAQGMMYYGDDFFRNQDQIKVEGLGTGFKMTQSTQGAWVNSFGRIVEYKDHTFSPVD